MLRRKKKLRKNLKTIIISLFLNISVAIYPIIFAYTKNAHEVYIEQIIYPLIISVGVTLILFLGFYLLYMDFVKASFVSILSILIFWTYGFIFSLIESIVPTIRHWHFIFIILLILFHVIIGLKKSEKENASIRKLTYVLGLTFLLLSVFNIAIAMPTITTKYSKAKEYETESAVAVSNLPNVYFIILDEYSSFEMIKKVYNYDNSEFKEFLIDKGFAFSDTSESFFPQTSMVVTNLINLDNIVTMEMPEVERFKLRENAKLFNVLRSYGYTTHAIDTFYQRFTGIEKVNADIVEPRSYQRPDDFYHMLTENTLIRPFAFYSISKSYDEKYYDIILTAFKKLKEESQNNNKQKFIYAHILSPHEPFVFNENGSIVGLEKEYNWDDKSLYLGQYKYVTKRIIDIINSITQYDSDSVIILQSDHGARLASRDLENSKQILNAVYYRGQKMDSIDGLSGLNTLRLVLNKLLSTNFEIVEE